MALPNFAVTGNLKEVLGDIASNELVETPLDRAEIIFESNIPAEAYVKWGTSLYRIDSVPAEVDVSGNVIAPGGGAVRLLAQDDGLNIRGLQWRVRVILPATVIPPRSSGQMRSFWFDAGADGDTVNLRSVAPAVAARVYGVGGGGGTGGSSAWGDVSDKPFDDDNKLLPENLPNLAITDYLGDKADQAAMLLTIGERGDWITRADTGAAYVIIANDTSLVGSWKQLPIPSVTWSTLSGKPAVIASGADAAAARTSIGVAYGSTSGTVAQGNDSRLSDTRAPTNGSVGIASHSATGTPSGTTFLRGDNVWAAPPGGGGGGGITAVVQDTAPALGGNLSPGSFTVGAATAADLTKLHAITATAAEANFVAGVTSAIQAQLNGKQASDADLSAIAALTSAADKVLYSTGANTWALTDFTTLARGLLGDTTVAAMLTRLQIPSDFVYVAIGSATARTVGSGDFTVGQYIGRAFTLTKVVYQFDTADASGNTVVEVRRNGTAVTSSSATVSATNQVDGTGTDAARTVTPTQTFAVGDRLLVQTTAIGTTPGKGLRAYLLGVWA